MSTPFEGVRRTGRCPEVALEDYPEWGLDVMRGLYGPATIDTACARRRARRRPMPPSADEEPRPLTALEAELVAVDALGTILMRLVRRR